MSTASSGLNDLAIVSTVFEGLTGSVAYGLASEKSDEDRRTVFMYPADRFWGLDQPSETLTPAGGGDWTLWEVAHFLRMLRKGSVNAFELLWLPDECVLLRDQNVWPWLVRQRDLFFTEALWKGWNGVIGGHVHEYDKLVREDAPFEKRCKEASQVLRLSLALFGAVESQVFDVRLPATDRSYVWDVKFATEQVTVDNGLRWAGLAQEEARSLYSHSPWSDSKNNEVLNRFLISQRDRHYRQWR